MERSARNSRQRSGRPVSCVKCRTLRVRCIREQQGGSCNRCNQEQIDCVAPRPGQFVTPRRRVLDDDRIRFTSNDIKKLNRLTDMNNKLENLMENIKDLFVQTMGPNALPPGMIPAPRPIPAEVAFGLDNTGDAEVPDAPEPDGSGQDEVDQDEAGHDGVGQVEFNHDQFNQGQFNQAEFNHDQFNQAEFNHDQFNQAESNHDQFNQGQFNHDQFNQAEFNQGQFNQVQLNQGQFNQAESNQAESNQAEFNHEQVNHDEVSNDEVNQEYQIPAEMETDQQPEWGLDSGLNPGLALGLNLGIDLDLGLDLDISNFDTLGPTELLPKETSPVLTNMDSQWITRFGLTFSILENLVDGFRNMASYFPFVIIPAGITVSSMAEDRPVLLLAAAAAASPIHHHLQQALSEEFKQTIDRRLAMTGERDLDLFLGLLVFVAWYHFYGDPRGQEAYQYLQKAIGVAVDLDLHYTACERNSDIYNRECHRSFLGCCYLSHLISTTVQQPNNFDASEQTVSSAIHLDQDEEYPTDKLICHLLRIQSLGEVITQSYQAGNAQVLGLPGFLQAEQITEVLGIYWSRIPVNLHSNVLLATSYRGMMIRIHQMGLAYRHSQKQQIRKNTANGAVRAPPKISINLTGSVSASKEYLDWIMAVPTTEYTKLPLAIWYQLIQAITVLHKLSLGLSNIPDWHKKITQQTGDLEEYFGTLAERFRSSLKDQSDPWSPTRCLFNMFAEMMDNAKGSYRAARLRFAHIRRRSDGHRNPGARDKGKRPVSVGGPSQSLTAPILRPPPQRSFASDPEFQRLVTADIEKIEAERLWADIIANDSYLNQLYVSQPNVNTSQPPDPMLDPVQGMDAQQFLPQPTRDTSFSIPFWTSAQP
ncbi:uncharacterized protein BDV14DRAFT_150064 [Aspergillus stella-maris]|uniref:uncharacterized protein n=1 Tax=Aspergillus stella-maris TaxID=1810926 RepID=UPI003CCDE5D8